jgi:hypothetical protein
MQKKGKAVVGLSLFHPCPCLIDVFASMSLQFRRLDKARAWARALFVLGKYDLLDPYPYPVQDW